MKPSIFKALLLMVFFGLMSCYGNKPEGDGEKRVNKSVYTDTLNLSLTAITSCMPLYYAYDRGLFDKQGVLVCLHSFQSQVAADTSLLGVADAGYSDGYSAAYKKLQAKSTLLIPFQEEWALLSNALLRLKSVNDLQGRVVGLDEKALPAFYLDKALLSTKSKPKDVMTANIGNYIVLEKMLNNNQVDAALLPQPYLSLAKGHGLRLLYQAVHTSAFPSGIYLKEGKKNAQLVRIFREVYNQAIDSINKHKGAALSPLYQKYAKLPASVADTIKVGKALSPIKF